MQMKRDRLYFNRKIYFYKIYAGNNAAGEPLNYDLKNVLDCINRLSFQTTERYLLDSDEMEICCWIDDLCPPQRVRFGKINRTILPQVEHRGILPLYQYPKNMVWLNVFMLCSFRKIL
jgi:hypothetical protein